MPVTEQNTNIFNYPMAKRGVNLTKNIVELHPDECIQAQNCIYRNGMVKRGGQNTLSDAEITTGNKIVGIHKFYKTDGVTKQIIAASGTNIKYDNSGTWVNIATSQTSGKQTHMATWGPLNHVYVTNETDDPFKWDGSTKTQFSTFGAANIPSTSALMFLPYQDRLLVIEGGDLRWSGAYVDGETIGDDWETVANCGVRPDVKLYGMINHSINNISSGEHGRVLLAGSNGMYLFSGRDLRTPSTTGDYRVDNLSIQVGCVAPRTMQWTPAGSMWLGVDRQVYLLPFNSLTPIPVSQKIFSNHSSFEGIESIPSGQMPNACAVYHKGFYILSVAQSGQTTNNVQWWLDVSRLQQDENGHWGPWYGQMLGQSISCFALQNGHGDSGELLGGESDSSVGSYVYFLNDLGIFGDNNSSIQVIYQTFFHPLGNFNFKKNIHKIEAELLDVLGTVIVGYSDIAGSLKTNDNFGLSGFAIYWNDNYWGEQDWSSSSPTRQKVSVSPTIEPRRMALTIEHNRSDDKFELYSLNVEAKEKGLVFT